MKKNVYDYFTNLDEIPLQREKGAILETSKNMGFIDDCEDMCSVNNSIYYYKYIGDLSDNFQALASCDLFNYIGILTPPIYLTKVPQKPLYSQISPEININKDFSECKQASFTPILKPFFDRHNCVDDYKWKILQNKDICEYFLNFMTPECFDELINMFLVDELRSEGDRHYNNYFFYKNHGSDKFNGIIPIDFDLVAILDFEDCGTRESFNSFLKKKYCGKSPLTKVVKESHENNILNIKKLIDEGRLTECNVEALKTALNFDFPAAVNKYADKYQASDFERNRIYTPLSFLWEYNREQLKELV